MDQIVDALHVIIFQLHFILLKVQEIFGPLGTTGLLIGIVIVLSLVSTFSFNHSGSPSTYILIPIALGAVVISALM